PPVDRSSVRGFRPLCTRKLRLGSFRFATNLINLLVPGKFATSLGATGWSLRPVPKGELFGFPPRCASMSDDDIQSKTRATAHDGEKSNDKAQIVEVLAEGGDQIEPPPPEILEPDPEL